MILNEINASTESTVLNSGKQPLAPARASDLSSNCGRLERLEEWDPKVSDAHYNFGIIIYRAPKCIPNKSV